MYSYLPYNYDKVKMEFLKKYNETGPCELLKDNVVKDWERIPHLWLISQWHDEYSLIRYRRKKCASYVVKVTINKETAEYLIKSLKLTNIKSGIFKHGSSWKKDTHATYNK